MGSETLDYDIYVYCAGPGPKHKLLLNARSEDVMTALEMHMGYKIAQLEIIGGDGFSWSYCAFNTTVVLGIKNEPTEKSQTVV